MASNRELSTLGRTLAEIQDDALQRRARPPERATIAAIYQARARGERKRTRLVRLSYGVGAAVLAAAVMLFLLRPRALEFRIGDGAGPAQLGRLLGAPSAGAENLSFSDGSRIVLRAGAQARVISSTERGARVVIERGLVHADVVPRAKNDWSLFGGPFEIHVTGTRFDSSWDPERQQLFVQMHEGHVLISAECLAAPRALKAGQSATFSCVAERASAVLPEAANAPTLSSNAPASNAPAPSARAAPIPSESNAPFVEPAPRSASWRELSALGDYAGAFAAADAEGFDWLCETLPSSELLELASTARLAGRSERASNGYAAVRRRFAGSESAASAAFHLGQLAFDGSRDYPAAQRFFGTYLSECQSCQLASEALGRRMEAEQRSGQLELARASAQQYLRRFPKGAHARLAESLKEP